VFPIVVLHGSQQQEGQCFLLLRYMVTDSRRASVSIVAGSVKEEKTIQRVSPRPSAFGVSLRQSVSGISA
jgi:hypothetical protein